MTIGSVAMTGHGRPKRLLALVGSLLALGTAASACSSSGSHAGGTSTSSSGSAQAQNGAPSGTPYYLAAELSLSGTYSSFEAPMLQGLQVAVEDINKSGGVLGHPVALDYQSDDSDSTKVQIALQSIFSADKQSRIIYMLPNVLPPVTDTVLQYTQQHGIPSFDPGSGGDVFDISKHPYNFSIYPANTLQVPAYVTAFIKLAGSASNIKLGVLNDTQVSDQTLSGLITRATKQAGGTVVDQEQVAPSATYVSVQVRKLQAAGANIVLVQSSGSVPVEAAQAVQQLNWTGVKLVASPASVNAHTQSAIPQGVASQFNTLGEQVYLRNSQGTGPLPQYETFATELAKTQGGIDDLEISANVRDSAVLTAWAINQAKSTDIHKVLAVLENVGTNPPPSGLLVWTPNPHWTSTDHTFDHADLANNFWALVSPGTEVQGTLQGQALSISPQIAQIGQSLTSSAG